MRRKRGGFWGFLILILILSNEGITVASTINQFQGLRNDTSDMKLNSSSIDSNSTQNDQIKDKIIENLRSTLLNQTIGQNENTNNNNDNATNPILSLLKKVATTFISSTTQKKGKFFDSYFFNPANDTKPEGETRTTNTNNNNKTSDKDTLIKNITLGLVYTSLGFLILFLGVFGFSKGILSNKTPGPTLALILIGTFVISISLFSSAALSFQNNLDDKNVYIIISSQLKLLVLFEIISYVLYLMDGSFSNFSCVLAFLLTAQIMFLISFPNYDGYYFKYLTIEAIVFVLFQVFGLYVFILTTWNFHTDSIEKLSKIQPDKVVPTIPERKKNKKDIQNIEDFTSKKEEITIIQQLKSRVFTAERGLLRYQEQHKFMIFFFMLLILFLGILTLLLAYAAKVAPDDSQFMGLFLQIFSRIIGLIFKIIFFLYSIVGRWFDYSSRDFRLSEPTITPLSITCNWDEFCQNEEWPKICDKKYFCEIEGREPMKEKSNLKKYCPKPDLTEMQLEKNRMKGQKHLKNAREDCHTREIDQKKRLATLAQALCFSIASVFLSGLDFAVLPKKIERGTLMPSPISFSISIILFMIVVGLGIIRFVYLIQSYISNQKNHQRTSNKVSFFTLIAQVLSFLMTLYSIFAAFSSVDASWIPKVHFLSKSKHYLLAYILPVLFGYVIPAAVTTYLNFSKYFLKFGLDYSKDLYFILMKYDAPDNSNSIQRLSNNDLDYFYSYTPCKEASVPKILYLLTSKMKGKLPQPVASEMQFSPNDTPPEMLNDFEKFVRSYESVCLSDCKLKQVDELFIPQRYYCRLMELNTGAFLSTVLKYVYEKFGWKNNIFPEMKNYAKFPIYRDEDLTNDELIEQIKVVFSRFMTYEEFKKLPQKPSDDENFQTKLEKVTNLLGDISDSPSGLVPSLFDSNCDFTFTSISDWLKRHQAVSNWESPPVWKGSLSKLDIGDYLAYSFTGISSNYCTSYQLQSEKLRSTHTQTIAHDVFFTRFTYDAMTVVLGLGYIVYQAGYAAPVQNAIEPDSGFLAPVAEISNALDAIQSNH